MEPELIRLYQQSINVILDGIRSTLEPDGIDREEVKILEEVDKWKKEKR